MTCKRPTRLPGRIQAALLLARAVTVSCGSTQEADEQEAVEAEFSFAFEDGAEGWTAGFADLPVDFGPSIYELDSGHRPLPDGLDGNGLYMQGHNRSDDLFLSYRSQVDKRPIDGLEPDAEYAAVLTLDLATNVPAGLVGIGGAPGEEYRIKTLDNSASPAQVTADGEGRLWLIVGTDSGFEGLSAFYYARIACTLTPVEPRDSEASLLGFDRSPDSRDGTPGLPPRPGHGHRASTPSTRDSPHV